MILSMTGFSSKTTVFTLEDGSKITIAFNLKSLNSRFFETTCKMPYQLSQFETEFIQLFKKQLHRGHIFLTIHWDNASLMKGSIEPSLPTIQNYLRAIESIKEKFNIQSPFTMSDLLRLPDIFYSQEQTINEAAKRFVFETITALVQELVAAQKNEGLVLKNDLEERIEVIKKHLHAIEISAAEHMERQKAKILERIKELSSLTGEQSPESHRNLLYNMLDKIDIHEEIVRFKSHLKNLTTILESPKEENGKLIDFTLQELARENNTISAKCSDADMSSLAISIKVEIEKAREQTQNIV